MADADFNPGSLILGSHSAETTQMWAVRHGNCPGRPQLVRLWGSPDFMGLKRAGCRESAHCSRRHLTPGTLPLLSCDLTCLWKPSCVHPNHVQSLGVGSRGRATGKELLLPAPARKGHKESDCLHSLQRTVWAPALYRA